MNTILQQRIEEAAMQVPFERGTRESFRDGATFILSHLWISVEEGLPEEKGRYLVYAPTYRKGSSSGLDFVDGIGFSRFVNGKWSIETGYHKRPNCVTHWCSLPKLPEKKGGEE